MKNIEMLQSLLTFGVSIFATVCYLRIEQSLPEDYSQNIANDAEFDVIIVGSGAAGSALASRLSENENMKILLVEAGGYPPGNTEVPGFFLSTFKTEIDWGYVTEPMPNTCLGFGDQRCTIVSGKVLGGSTSINAMLYNRALPETYDNWYKMGNSGWDFKSLEKYYNLFESSAIYSDGYGKKGAITLSQAYKGYGEYRELIYNASKDLGMPWKMDNGKLGFIESYTMTINKRRFSSAKAYLAPIKLRSNLFLSLNTLATKLLFNENLATGIEVRIGDKYFNLKAKHEIIISAGAIETPKLLMLSGIGPKEHLNSLGIPVKVELPVGKNYQDHMIVLAIIALVNIYKSNNLIWSLLEYCVLNEGFLGESSYNIQWFINTKNNTSQSNGAIQFVIIPKDRFGLITSVYKNALNMNDSIAKSLWQGIQNNTVIQLAPILTTPQSRGEILLRSKDPNDRPKIFGNYLSDPNDEDLETLLEIIEFIKRFVNTSSMQMYDMKLYHLEIPNCKGISFDTRDYWKCFIKNLASPSYHPVGTCKMAPHGDPTGVVTPDFKVVGLDHIRIIDASIMPEIVDRNPISAINVIAHKGADLVISDWMNHGP